MRRSSLLGTTVGAFDSLRLDRITALTPLPGLFVDEPGKRLADYEGRKP